MWGATIAIVCASSSDYQLWIMYMLCGVVAVAGEPDCVQCGISQMQSRVAMAQKVTVALEDDLDGRPAEETVRFAVGGSEYEIDLSTKNAAAFRKHLAPFVEHARRARRGQSRHGVRTAASRPRSGDIRAWANDHGITVSGRGRIPASVVEQYEAATKGR
jgi:nucleoid-associated protein Lsr2